MTTGQKMEEVPIVFRMRGIHGKDEWFLKIGEHEPRFVRGLSFEADVVDVPTLTVVYSCLNFDYEGEARVVHRCGLGDFEAEKIDYPNCGICGGKRWIEGARALIETADCVRCADWQDNI